MDLVRNSFKKKAEDPSKMTKKYIQLSGHDSNLAPYYMLLGKANLDCIKNDIIQGTRTEGCQAYPPTATSMVWELIQNVAESKKYGIKFSINGEYLDFCKLGKKDKSGEFYCPIDELDTAIDTHYYYKDYVKACGWQTFEEKKAD